MQAIVAFLFLAIFAGAAAAQEPEARRIQDARDRISDSTLPRETVRRILATLDDPAVTRIHGPAELAAGDVVDGDVIAIGGPFSVAGRIHGDLTVLEGDLELAPGAVVEGDVLVVGGVIRGRQGARIAGAVTLHDGVRPPSVRPERDRPVLARRPPGRTADWSGGTVVLRFGPAYNRVEGLPVRVGPVLRTEGANPLQLQALAIWRTEGLPAGVPDRVGYDVRVEQFLGGRQQYRVGASLRSEVDPIEEAGLTDLETSLSTFLFGRDQRDHFQRRGFRVHGRWTPRELPLDALVEYRHERHRSLPAGDPWALFDGGGEWRFQPLVAEGTLRSLVLRTAYEGRRLDEHPLAGWYLGADLEVGLGGELAVPAVRMAADDESPVAEQLPPAARDATFATGTLDVRRYFRMGRRAELALRGVAGGRIMGDGVLPPQYQRALGGPGTLPGYPLFHADCGARAVAVRLEDEESPAFFPAYGCDRFTLFQAQYQGPLGLDIGWFGEEVRTPRRWRRSGRHGPLWALFFNAGRAWDGGAPDITGAAPARTLYDGGIGLLLGDAGIFLAVPLANEDVRNVRFFARLSHRF